ncbi:MAG: hypothetical protein ACMXYF_05535 [Candidatus Woesearchaeota archaeon]
MLPDRILSDCIDTLFRTKVSLSQGDLSALKSLSNRTIHNASVFQDKKSVQLAVIIYALSKILTSRPHLKEQFIHMIDHAHTLLLSSQENAYEQLIEEMATTIETFDPNIKLYVEQVLEQAKIKKGSRIYYHGISLGQTAKTVGVSQWELYDYIGKAHLDEKIAHKENITQLRKRLAYTRKVLKQKKPIAFVCDTGPIISLALNNLLGVLEELKKRGHIDFLLPKAVNEELIERPLRSKKYKLEAMQITELLRNGTFVMIEKQYLTLKTKELLALINSTFFAFNKSITLVQEGEMQAIALAKLTGSPLLVDERTTRYLIENPTRVIRRFEAKLHTRVHVDTKKLAKIKQELKGLHTIRSAELLAALFLDGMFDEKISHLPMENAKKEYLDALLWAVKLSGCGITDNEIRIMVDRLA